IFLGNDGSTGNELWRSDGTDAGTYMLADLDPRFRFGSDPGNFTVIGNTLYFTANEPDHGAELWKTDGTTAGTMLMKDIAPGATGSSPTNLLNVDGRLFF